jgi:hypothetical protein
VAFETSIAIGVVTDLGANEQIISGVAPSHFGHCQHLE